MRWFLICCILVCACLLFSIQSTDCVVLVHLCEQGSNGSYRGPVNIVNVEIAQLVTQRQCTCNIIADTNVTVTLRLLIVIQRQESKLFPLTITYTEDNRKRIVNSLLRLQTLGFEDAGIIVARNVADLSIEMARGTNITQVRFMLNIAAPEDVKNGQIIISCKSENETGNATEEDSGSEYSGNNDVVKFMEKLCSPFLLILLISVCVALLLIILMVSVILCCVMPRTQRQQIQKIRQSMSLDADLTFDATGADSIRLDTMIYENVDKNTSFSRTLPMDRRRQEYAKTSYKQSNLYQNI